MAIRCNKSLSVYLAIASLFMPLLAHAQASLWGDAKAGIQSKKSGVCILIPFFEKMRQH